MFQCWIIAAALAASPDVDFDTEVLPVLTRAGCNTGACHGAAAGRGGFKLSLFAGNPVADQATIVHELEGRRINLAQPESSLILAKTIGYVDHEGGVLFDLDSEDAAILRRWIEQGAERRAVHKLDGLRVTPSEALVPGLNDQVSLQVTAHFDDGTERDVTRWSLYSSTDPGALSVDGTGKVRVLRHGRSSVIVRFLTEMRTVQVTVPIGEKGIDSTALITRNWVDDEIHQMLEALRIPVSPTADDSALLRRLRLDLTGRLPTPAECRSFLSDTRVDKYERLVETLVNSDEFTDFWTYRLSRWLQMPAYSKGEDFGSDAYFSWLRKQVAADVGWDAMSRELLLATGDSHVLGPANFHRQSADARSEAEHIATTMMGVELRCANCHNHPLDKWTQDDYHGLAAIFARLDRNRVVTLRSRGEVTHPLTAVAAIPRLPGLRNLEGESDPRAPLATWLTSKDNPYFATAFVNRVWKALMGRGLVEPSDALRVTNPATHPRLLERLAEDFAVHDFRLRHVVRTIVASESYRRSARPLIADRESDADRGSAANRDDDRYYSHALLKPMSTEVYVDAVADVTGIPELVGPLHKVARSIQQLDAATQVPGVSAALGCTGKTCVASESMGVDLAARLRMINGEFLNAKLAAPGSHLVMLVTEGESDQAIIADLYLRALSRLPSHEESQFWIERLGGGSEGKMKRYQDFCWSLLNCREFVTNH